jgi:hypothetical protein
MYASPQALTEVTISGKRVMVEARFADAYQRLGRANGDFFTREGMDSLHAVDMKSLLQMIPGVLVNDRGITFLRCEGNVFAQNPAYNPFDGTQRPRAASAQAAKVQVYVDGVRVTTTGDDAFAALRDIRPSSLQLVEVYRGLSRIPGEYLDDACAVILLWTR